MIRIDRYRAILWGAWFLFCAAFIFNVITNYPVPNAQIDEQAHLAYADHLITQHRWWPDFAHFMLPEPPATHNYLNHPPTFYWVAKAIHAITPSLPLLDYRYVCMVLIITAMALHARSGTYALNHSLSSALIYAMLPFLLYAQYQMGFFNNDAAALLGGMLAVWASLSWFSNHHPRRACGWMLLGIALASVKLTSLLLVGSYVTFAILLHPSARRQLRMRDWILSAAMLLIIMTPYLIMALQWGSPAPETPGQIELMQKPATLGELPAGMEWVFAPGHGWIKGEPLDFFHWLATFITNFADQLNVPELTFIPLLLIVLCFAILCIKHRLWRTQSDPALQVARACLLATLAVLIIHATFSWRRYQLYGWLIDSFVRYYFPLLSAYGIVCMAGLQTLSGTKRKVL